MANRDEQDIRQLAEELRAGVPEGYISQVESLEHEFAAGRPFEALRKKGKRASPSDRILTAVLDELSLFLCTNDPKYKSLRKDAAKLDKTAVHFVAGIIVGALGITSGVATGCVAFAALACLRVGIGAFCRVHPPKASETKARGKP